MHQSKRPIRNKKNLVYKGRKYPIDFDLLAHFSDYFYENKNLYVDENIELPEENIDISEETMQLFANFCNNERIENEISNSSVLGLRQLSNHYEIIELKNLVEEYISKNPNLLVQLDLINITTDCKSEDIERNISSHFFEFIDDEKLLSLPIPSLYRILNCHQLNFNDLNETDQNKLLDFLFKCLKKNGKKASVLFLNIELENARIDLITTLLNDYSDCFDFNMLNPKMGVKTIHNLMDEITRLKLTFSDKIDKMSQIINKQQQDYARLESQIENITKMMNEQKTQIEQNEQIQLNKLSQKIDDNQKSDKEELDKLKQKMELMGKSFEDYHSIYKRNKQQQDYARLESQIENITKMMNEQKTQIEQNEQIQLNKLGQKIDDNQKSDKEELEKLKQKMELMGKSFEDYQTIYKRYNENSPYLIPIKKKWKKNPNGNCFELNENGETYKVVCSSYVKDTQSVQNLFDGEKEVGNDHLFWATNPNDQSRFIQIYFSKPKVANLLEISSRSKYIDQSPLRFEIFGVDENGQGHSLQSFTQFCWNANDQKFFAFFNEHAFPSYLIKFYESSSPHVAISELNLKKI